MRALMRWTTWAVLRALLALRYRIEVEGLDDLDVEPRRLLVLCNHPGFVDPLLVFGALWPRLQFTPLLFAENFPGPLRVGPWMLDALVLPQITGVSRAAEAQARAVVDGVVRGLADGRAFVLWPAGRLYREGRESLRSTRALAEILAADPEAQVVLVRTRGVWGSRFSWAYTGRTPQLVPTLLRCAALTFAALGVLLPKRRVHITVERLDRAALPDHQRDTVNRTIEDWFNAPGTEEPTFVPAHPLFGPRHRDWPPIVEFDAIDTSGIPEPVIDGVRQLIARHVPGELPPVTGETTLEDLGLDSIERMALTLEVQERFGFRSDEMPRRVDQLWALAAGLTGEAGVVEPTPPLWTRRTAQGSVDLLADTVPQAFVARALANRRRPVVADDSGVLTYERLLVGARLLARRLRDLPGDAVGVMLPATVACDLAVMGVHLAGKLPVMINWTTGAKNVAHGCRLLGLSHIVTSERFLDRAGVSTPDGVEVYPLERLRTEVGSLEKLAALLTVRLRPGLVRAQTPSPSPEQAAVVLFTSGSERAPKAVPLSHRNLLSCLTACFQVLDIRRDDVLLSFLPPFHSFGMTLGLLMPLLGGLRAAHHPDPTDAGRLAAKARTYRATLLCATPTFMRYILGRATDGQLDTVRLAAVGAESCPPDVFTLFAERAPNGVLVEGYGITECSPVVAANPADAPRVGTIGVPLPDVQVVVVDPDQPALSRPPGEMGMLLVRGPTVFDGYLGEDAPDPFVDHDGQRWYSTGDLVRIDDDGYLHFRGRLKRFLKSAGEMISLPALEAPLAEAFPPDDDGPRVAVEGVELPGGQRRIVCYCRGVALTADEANRRLASAGYSGLMRLDAVEEVESIPLLGTGKTDYKVLRRRLQESLGQPV